MDTARVFVPNRSITNVVNYPKGYIRAYLDARLPDDPDTHAEAERRLTELAQASYEQYPGILLLPPSVEGIGTPRMGSVVLAANMPGRWAAPPAPAIMALRPR